MGDLFKFKQFDVDQAGCSMRINTDGVLLAVKATEDSVNRVLDIGTGTGVIAMMLAQLLPEASIDAIDIDQGAFSCADNNFKNCPFSDRLAVYHSDIKDFETAVRYDLIVSNPPFFLNSLKNSNERKTLSRHGSIQFYDALFNKCDHLLTDRGSFKVIWPIDVRDHILAQKQTANLHLTKEIYISSFPESAPFRIISSFKKLPDRSVLTESFHIYKEQGVYSEAYLELLKPFFIKY